MTDRATPQIQDSTSPAPLKLRACQRVFRYDAAATRFGLPQGLVGSPFLDQAGRDFALANAYLEALWLGLWSGSLARTTVAQMVSRVGLDGSAFVPVAASSVHKAAQRLSHALDWADCPEVHATVSGRFSAGPTNAEGCLDILRATGHDVVRLGHDMRAPGRFTVSGKPASQAYAQACQVTFADFLSFLAYKNLRSPVVIPERRPVAAGRSGWPRSPETPRSSGRVDPATQEHVPAVMVARLVAAVPRASYRMAMRLACELGIRADETITLRDAHVPTASSLGDRAGLVQVLGKGSKWRQVAISDELLRAIDAYRRGPRAAAAMLRRENEADELLLDDRDGRPLRYHELLAVYHAAAERVSLRAAWTPHIARHHYAVEALLREWRLIELAADRAGGDRLKVLLFGLDNLMEAPLEELRRNLGHTSLAVTRRYLATMRRAARSTLAENHERRILGNRP